MQERNKEKFQVSSYKCRRSRETCPAMPRVASGQKPVISGGGAGRQVMGDTGVAANW